MGHGSAPCASGVGKMEICARAVGLDFSLNLVFTPFKDLLGVFGGDFVKSYAPQEGFGSHSKAERAVLHFASKYLPKEQADYLRAGRYSIEYLDYDWSLNEQKD